MTFFALSPSSPAVPDADNDQPPPARKRVAPTDNSGPTTALPEPRLESGRAGAAHQAGQCARALHLLCRLTRLRPGFLGRGMLGDHVQMLISCGHDRHALHLIDAHHRDSAFMACIGRLLRSPSPDHARVCTNPGLDSGRDLTARLAAQPWADLLLSSRVTAPRSPQPRSPRRSHTGPSPP